MDTRGDLALFERLAVARLQYTVNELQTKVDCDRRLSPPVRKIFHCITDDSALVQSIAKFKSWTTEDIISMTVPLCTLDALDDLKKGTEQANVNSRESIRFFDRCQSGAGRKPVRGVRVQAPSEMFAKWEECAKFQDPHAPVPAMPPQSPPRSNGYSNGYNNNHNHNNNNNGYTNGGSNGGSQQRRGSRAGGPANAPPPPPPVVAPPKWIQPILNCALHKMHPPGKDPRPNNDVEETVLVTNNEAVAAWAKVYGIKAVDSQEIADLVEHANWDFQEKKSVYEARLSGGGRGGRSGSIGGRGGRGGGGGGGGGRGGHRRNSSRDDGSGPMGFSPRGNHEIDPSYVLRGAPRGVARGRGKLWEP